MAFKKGDKNINKKGRPKGATTRPLLRNYMTEAEITKFMKDLLRDAEKDMGLKKFVAEQILGKAPQAVELGGLDGKDLIVEIINYGDIKRKVSTKGISNSNK